MGGTVVGGTVVRVGVATRVPDLHAGVALRAGVAGDLARIAAGEEDDWDEHGLTLRSTDPPGHRRADVVVRSDRLDRLDRSPANKTRTRAPELPQPPSGTPSAPP